MHKKTRLIHVLSTRDPPQNERYTQNESKGMEKILHGNRKEIKAVVAILISDKIDFRNPIRGDIT